MTAIGMSVRLDVPLAEALVRSRTGTSRSSAFPGRPELEPIAAEAKTRLQAALATIAAPTS